MGLYTFAANLIKLAKVIFGQKQKYLRGLPKTQLRRLFCSANAPMTRKKSNEAEFLESPLRDKQFKEQTQCSQLAMAKITGNFKRGNEKAGKRRS